MITMIIYNATPYNLLALGDQLFNRLQLVWRKIPDDLIDQLDRIVAHASIHVSKPFSYSAISSKTNQKKKKNNKRQRKIYRLTLSIEKELSLIPTSSPTS